MKFIPHYEEIPAAEFPSDKVKGVSVRRLLGAADGAPGFALRIFTVQPGGYTLRHTHPFEHENYVIRGRGRLETASGPKALAPGAVILIAPNDLHQFVNDGDEPLEFICLVPNEYDK